MKTLPAAIVMAFLCLQMTVGCEGGAAADGPGDGGEDEDDVVDEEAFIAGWVAVAEACEGSSFSGRAQPILTAALAGDLRVALRAQLLEELTHPDVVFDGRAAAACLVALDPVDCEAFDAGGPAVCDDVLVGTVVVGGDCAFDGACATGSCFFDGGPCGVCAEPAGLGGNCIENACARGLVCDLTVDEESSTTGTCIVRVVAGGDGAVCGDRGDCAEGFGCEQGVCRAAIIVGVGEICGSVKFCVDSFTSNLCITVDPDEGVERCTPRPHLGEACQAIPLCDVVDSSCDGGVCVAPGEVGDACGGGRTCALGLRCDVDVCVAFYDDAAPIDVCE